MPKKKVRVHYRRYYRTSEPPIRAALNAAISKALRETVEGVSINSDVSLRRYEDQDGASIILNGRYLPPSGDIYGELVRYNPDTNIPLLMQESGSVEELEIREANKPNNAEFLRGISFFLVRGDHVLVIEQDLTTSALERYFRWLLCTRTRISEHDARVQLIPRVFLNDNQDSLREVNLISFSPPPVSPSEFGFGTGGVISADSDSSTLSSILSVLKAAHFDTSVIERLAAENHAAVEIRLDVKFKSGRKKVSLHGEDALALLRNVPEDDLIISGDGARMNRGVLERLSVEHDVERKGNILDRKDAWRALNEAAVEHKRLGLIE